MTGFGLIAAIVWALVGALFVERLHGFARAWLAQRVSDRPTAPVEIPDDLVGLAMEESERHAQDSVLEAIREAFVKYGNWNKVRAARGVATRDGEA